MTAEFLLLIAIFLIAMLYSSVGHGGASGYLALLAMSGAGIMEMRSTALLLNICVSAIAFAHFLSNGHFSWRRFWPFAAGSIPFSFIGAGLDTSPFLYRKLLAICLVFAVGRILFTINAGSSKRVPSPPLAILIGAAIGLLSGTIGIGGGIILGPILLIAGWSTAHQAAAICSLFILVNSMSGIVGLPGADHFTGVGIPWVISAIAGGTIGSFIGARRIPDLRLRQVLGSVLLIASLKLFIA